MDFYTILSKFSANQKNCNISIYAKYPKKTKRDALNSTPEIIKKKIFVSKDPMGLTGAIVYMACKKNGEHIIQYQIANATGVTLVTLRKNLRL
jgi:transcription initiation factor TFIIIB Brf1 subunit/transcription initiation factor TFIIB